MKITQVKATTHNIPVDVPLLNTKTYRPITFAAVETDEGIAGYGLTSAPQRSGIKEFINREVAPFLKGKNPLETERVWHELQRTFNARSQGGAWSGAVSAIDIALWDIKGKKYSEPVWRLLGGAQNPVACYITFGLREFNIEQLVEMAKRFVNEGQDKLKMVVGINQAQNHREDARRVKAVREAIGEAVDLMVDGNCSFPFNRALELCKLLEPYRLAWFEEPVYQNDAKLLADLRRRTSIPLSAGQGESNRFRHRELIINQAVDILQPNVCYGGGYTEAMKVAAMAQTFNLLIANGGGWPHHNMHFFAAVPNGWRVEFHYVMWKVGETIYHDPPVPSRGWVTLREDPGLGLEPRWDALKEYEER